MGTLRQTAAFLPAALLALLALGFLLLATSAAQQAAKPAAAPDCTVTKFKVLEADRVRLSRWSGGGWMTNAEAPPETGQVWLVVNGMLACPEKGSSLPLGGLVLVDESSKAFPVVGYTSGIAPGEEAEFNFLEGSPGTGRMQNGKPLWGVMPGPRGRTLYLNDELWKPGPSVDIALLFAVPRNSGDFYLTVAGRRDEKVPRGKRSGASRQVRR